MFFISSDPEQFTKEISSPLTSNTPEPTQDDIGKLVSNVEELRKSLSIIREKSVTPVNSPRGVSNATTPNTAVKRDKIPQSPPTKDTGNTLQDMRYVFVVIPILELILVYLLRYLFSCFRNRLRNLEARIPPKRSLTFAGGANTLEKDSCSQANRLV